MKRMDITITDKSGMHIRPASKLAGISRSYHSAMRIKYKDQLGDLKSVISILKLGIKYGDTFEIEVEGEDEEEAFLTVKKVIMDSPI